MHNDLKIMWVANIQIENHVINYLVNMWAKLIILSLIWHFYLHPPYVQGKVCQKSLSNEGFYVYVWQSHVIERCDY